MRNRLIAAAAAVITLAGVAAVLLLQRDAPTKAIPSAAPVSIAPLPEHVQAPPTDPAALTELDRCVAAGQCQLVQTEKFGKATVEVYQQNSALPAVHIRTSFADGAPQVWSLEDEHAATFRAMSCGLANCLLDVVVGPEAVASIDMRLVSNTLVGNIEGAAVGPSLSSTAADLNSDGVLDLVTAEHLIREDGSELFFYRTFVNQDRQLVATGCTVPAADAVAPQTLQVRTCPAH